MRLLDACFRRCVGVTPIWLLHQAGGYLPEFRAIHDKLSLVEMCRRPDVAAEVTLQPLRRFELDAAVLFSDIFLPLEPMGIGFRAVAGKGAVVERPVRYAADLERVRGVDAAGDLPYVMDALRLVRHELDARTALIGIAGAPFTLASYMIEGGLSRSYPRVKRVMYEQTEVFERLMSLVSDVVSDYLLAQIAAGAQAVQLVDSCARSLAPFDYERFVLPHVRAVVEKVGGRGAPVVYHAGGAAGLLHLVARTGSDVCGVDWRVAIDRAWAELGDGVAIQGNLDPAALLGSHAAIGEHIADILRRVGGRPGHIFNVGHGLLPQTPPDNVRYLVDAVHRLSAGPRV